MAELKRVLVYPSILGYPDFSKPFILEVDASHLGLGAVLSQEQNDRIVVLSYASRALRPAEKNIDRNCSVKLELLALKSAVSEKYRDILIGAKCTVFTDNDPLTYVQKTAKLGATEMRWIGRLAQFDIKIKYRSGKVNRNANSLSRKTCRLEKISVECLQNETFVAVTTTVPLDLKNQIKGLVNDVWVEEVKAQPQRIPSQMIPSSCLPFLSSDQIAQLQTNDTDIGRPKVLWEKKCFPSSKILRKETGNVKKLVSSWNRLSMDQRVLYRSVQLYREPFKQVILPSILKKDVLPSVHDSMGHQCPKRILSILEKRCYWPNITRDVTDNCSKCSSCLLGKYGKNLKTTITSLSAQRPLDILSIDFTVLEPGVGNILLSIHKQYRQETKQRKQLQESWSVIGLFVLEYPRDYTVIKGEILKERSFKSFVTFMEL